MSRHDFRSTETYFVFRAGEAMYALPATSVREVARPPRVITVPHSSSILSGLCQLRNELLPVFEIESLLGGTAKNAADDVSQLLVINGHEGPWALLIHRAIGLEPIEIASSTEGDWNDVWSRVFVGTGSHSQGIVKVLDPQNLYQLISQTLQHFWQPVSESIQPLDVSTVASEPAAVNLSEVHDQ